MRRDWCIALIACTTLATLAYANRDRLLFAAAVSSSEARPGLLAEAKWNRPDSATAFRQKFHAGVAERALIGWLRENRFTLDPASRSATRRIESLPCNERIDIGWSVDTHGKLATADATVAEAGCL